jgi:hypothetical protein
MAAKRKKPPITTLHCADCGETVSGPDVADVKATMARHTAKKHKAKTK